MDSALTPVLEILGEEIKNLDINAGTGGGGVGIEIFEIAVLEYKWEVQLNEVAA